MTQGRFETSTIHDRRGSGDNHWIIGQITEGETNMALLTVQHNVRDYQTWRAVYDSMGEVQEGRGGHG